MGKYRKLPVVIEAVQLGWSTWCEICDFVDYDSFEGVCHIDSMGAELPKNTSNNGTGLRIKTLEGIMIASEGDYIIKGVNGEFYPCKPQIFEKTYEAVLTDEEEELAEIEKANESADEYLVNDWSDNTQYSEEDESIMHKIDMEIKRKRHIC